MSNSIEFDIMHIPTLLKLPVECKRMFKRHRCMTRLALWQIKIFAQQWTEVRMCTVFNDGLSTLTWRLATKVGDTLFGDDDHD